MTVYPAESKEKGGCTSCSRYKVPEGVLPHRVTVVQIGTEQWRLCPECSAALQIMLRNASRPTV